VLGPAASLLCVSSKKYKPSLDHSARLCTLPSPELKRIYTHQGEDRNYLDVSLTTTTPVCPLKTFSRQVDSCRVRYIVPYVDPNFTALDDAGVLHNKLPNSTKWYRQHSLSMGKMFQFNQYENTTIGLHRKTRQHVGPVDSTFLAHSKTPY